MKICLLSLFLGFCFFFSFLFGFRLGLASRSYYGMGSFVKDDPCTCAPCLPDLWCKKCKHKSRDCPKLSWFFHPHTNLSFRIVKPFAQ